MVGTTAYDTIGVGYSERRRPDRRIADQILRALADAARVVNIGAGTGSYESVDRPVVAVEPSAVMISQRGPGAAPAVRGIAEALPFADSSFDAALAVLTVHHWSDLDAGLAELRRVAPRQVVLTFDEQFSARFWLTEYFPQTAALEAARAPRIEAIAEPLHAARVEVVAVPHDCSDGFAGAYWRRPDAYFDATVRAGISSLAAMPADELERGLARLRADLESGAWHERHADLLALDEIDLGYRLVIAGG